MKALEPRWRTSELDITCHIYCAKRQHVNVRLHAARHDYYSTIVTDNSHDSKSHFKVIDLFHRDRQSPLPVIDSPELLATDFSDFLFHEDIDNLLLSWKNCWPRVTIQRRSACVLQSFALQTSDREGDL